MTILKGNYVAIQISGGVTLTAGVVLTTAGGSTSVSSLSYGYVSGGYHPNSPAPANFVDNDIQKFSFSTDGDSTDVGDLTVGRKFVSGQSSTVSGYTSGGFDTGSSTTIDKFPFASDGNATDVGDLSISYGRSKTSGQSSADNGYVSGGVSNNHDIRIDKYPFSSDSNASNIGDLTTQRDSPAGQSSADNGYCSGGIDQIAAPAVEVNIIDKFPFASDGNATDVGDLTVARKEVAGQSSITNGYSSGGHSASGGGLNTIDKFPFASDSNATDVGDLLSYFNNMSGQSSSVSGYLSGGSSSTPANWNVIQKFDFTTDGNSTDVGDLLTAKFHSAGQQG